jgi:hypothetical protein
VAESARDILHRHQQMEADRQNAVESVWRDCFDYTYPIRGSGLSGSKDTPASAQGRQSRLFDNTAADSVNILASNIMAGMTPANSRWFDLDAGDETPDEKRWLSESADLLWQNIHMSNFDAEAFEGCLDAAIAGQFALYVDEDRERGGLAFEHWPLAELYTGSTRADGRIDVVHRKRCMPAIAMANAFGIDNLPEKIRACALDPKKQDEEFEVLHAIYPRRDRHGRMARNLPVASVHIAVAEKAILRESGYHEMPVVVPRWMRAPGSLYAVGPMYAALPDVKQLNYLRRVELDAADVAVSGMWIARDDGILNPNSIRIGPKKVVIAADTESMKALQTGSDFNLSEALVAQLKAAIRKTLMADQLVPQDGPQMTAEEVRVRVDMIRKLLGPVYGRLQAEYLTPLVERCFGLAYRAGVFAPPPESLQGRNFSVRFVSPMARAQRLDEVAAIERTVQTVAVMEPVYPGIKDELDPSKILELIGEGLGAPASIRRSEADKRKLRQARDQQQAAEQQQQLAQRAAEASIDNAAAASA